MHRDKMAFKRLAKSFKLNILFDYDFIQLQVGVIMPEPFNPSAAGKLPKQLRLLTWPWSWEFIQQFYTPSYRGNGYLHPQRRHRQVQSVVWVNAQNVNREQMALKGEIKPKTGRRFVSWGAQGRISLSCVHRGCPQKEQALRYNTEAQPYNSGDADVGTSTEFTHQTAPPVSDSCLSSRFSSQLWFPARLCRTHQPSRWKGSKQGYGAPRTPPKSSLSPAVSTEEKQAGSGAASGKGCRNTTPDTQLL